VPGLLSQRPFLAPAGHTRVDETLVAAEAGVRPEPETLHHARAEPLEQRVGSLDQPEHHLRRAFVLQVERHRPPTAPEGLGERFQAARLGPIDAQHVGAEIGEQHGPERHGGQPCELDDA
jgi:hypothetical protein